MHLPSVLRCDQRELKCQKVTDVLKPKVSLQIIVDEVVITFSRSGVCITACSLSRHFRCLSKTFKNIVASFRGIKNTSRENAQFNFFFFFFNEHSAF